MRPSRESEYVELRVGRTQARRARLAHWSASPPRVSVIIALCPRCVYRHSAHYARMLRRGRQLCHGARIRPSAPVSSAAADVPVRAVAANSTRAPGSIAASFHASNLNCVLHRFVLALGTAMVPLVPIRLPSCLLYICGSPTAECGV
jgi:hypothetical protein